MQTQAAYDFWLYMLITWHPESGLQFYGNGNLKVSAGSPKANEPSVSVHIGKQNFNLGRGLEQDPKELCGLMYLSSLAVFKRYLKQDMVSKIFTFFWSNGEWILCSFSCAFQFSQYQACTTKIPSCLIF